MIVILLLEDEVSSPEVIVEEITKKQAQSGEYGDFNELGINKNLSSNTIHMYRWYLSRMFDFYQLEDVSILDVSMVQNYVVQICGRRF